MATVQLCAAWLVEYMRMLLTPDLVLQEAAQACTISAHDATQYSSPALDERLCCRSWLAYPHFSPPERFQPFKLTEGLYLNNAWEKRGVGYGDVCSGGQELCSADCAAPQQVACMQQPESSCKWYLKHTRER